MPATDVLEQDEAVVEQGLANGALEFLRDAVLKSSAFYGKESAVLMPLISMMLISVSIVSTVEFNVVDFVFIAVCLPLDLS